MKKVAEELADLLRQHTVMVDPAHFPTWGDFLAEIRRKGCLIQACPPSESVTALTVSVLIEPDGAVRMLSAGDQVNPTPFWKWGVSVPQTSVDPSALSAMVDRVAAACLERGVCGHLSLDLVTFIAPTTVSVTRIRHMQLTNWEHVCSCMYIRTYLHTHCTYVYIRIFV